METPGYKEVRRIPATAATPYDLPISALDCGENSKLYVIIRSIYEHASEKTAP